MTRPSWDEYGLIIASAIATRGDCRRRAVGAVIFDKDRRIAGSGYNGAEPGGPSCLAGECPRGQHYLAGSTPIVKIELCACGELWPCPHAVAPGSSYDTGPGMCVATHAEGNALLYTDRDRRHTLYCTDEPCAGCWKLLRNSGLVRVVWPGGEHVI